MNAARLFLWPEALPLLLVPLLLWVLAVLRERVRRRRLAERVGPRHLLLASERSPIRRRLRHAAFALALLLGGIAALGPAFGGTAPGLAWPSARRTSRRRRGKKA